MFHRYLFTLIFFSTGLLMASEPIENIYPVDITKEAIELRSLYKSYFTQLQNHRKSADRLCLNSGGKTQFSLHDKIIAIAFLDTVIDINLCQVSEAFIKNKADATNYSPDCSYVRDAVKEFASKLKPQIKNCMGFYEKQLDRDSRGIASQVEQWAQLRGGVIEE